MKKYLFLFLAISLFIGCNDDDDDYNEHEYELIYVPAIGTNLPTEFEYGQYFKIDITIELQNSCYFNYNQYEYFTDGTTRIIYPISHVDGGIACTPNIRESIISIPFQALQSEDYLFKIYIGDDVDGEPMFEDIPVQVI